MKLECAQEALADALATVGRVVPVKPNLPVLANVLMQADPTSGLRVVATNLDLTISRRIPASVTALGQTTVPARLLADYVALLAEAGAVDRNGLVKGRYWSFVLATSTPRCDRHSQLNIFG